MYSTVQLSRFLSFWQLWYSIISFLACQELFQKVFSAVQLSHSFFDSHTRLSHLYRFVKNFLKLFSIDLSRLSVALKNPHLLAWAITSVLCESYVRISYLSTIVNNFFHFLFQRFFLSIGWVLIYHFLSSLSIIIAEKFYNFSAYF